MAIRGSRQGKFRGGVAPAVAWYIGPAWGSAAASSARSIRLFTPGRAMAPRAWIAIPLLGGRKPPRFDPWQTPDTELVCQGGEPRGTSLICRAINRLPRRLVATGYHLNGP